MNKKVWYLLFYGIPGLIAAFLTAVLVAAPLGSVFWTFIFGDNPWPVWVDYFIVTCAIIGFAIILTVSLILGYKKGKEQKSNEKINFQHVIVSASVVAFLIIVILLHQYSVGNIGSKPESVKCNDFCKSKGYEISSIPPSEDGDEIRDFCICLNDAGKEMEKALLKEITL